MGRIDDALRSSGAMPTLPTEDDAFVSPWAVGTPTREPEPVPPSARPEPHDVLHLDVASRLIGLPGDGIVKLKPEWRERLASTPGVDPALVEQFRRLGATVIQCQETTRLKLVMVTSATPSDGKTLTALNLALTLSESFRRSVLLIDADLRRPSITEAAGLPGAEGLSEALKASEDRKVNVIRLAETLTLLPAGRPDPDPMSGITSERMRRLLNDAASTFDCVILDAPPVGATAEAGLLASLSDGVLLVIRAGQTPHPAVQRAVEVVGRERILGVVLNAVDQAAVQEFAGYGGAYSPVPAR